MRHAAFLLVLVLKSVAAQPAIEWQRTLGGSLDDSGTSVEPTGDGGFIICGTTNSNNGDVSGNHGLGDIWLVKLDAQGDTEWQRTLGGSQSETGRWAGELPGIGYVVLGRTRSNDGDVSGNHGESDIWLAKVDMSGSPLWQRCYGGSLLEVPFGIQSTPNGGWVIAGESRSSDGDVSANAGFTDYWVLKLDANGEIEWERSYGGSGSETAYAIELSTDGGYILNGVSDSQDGDVTGNHGAYDYWVVKLDADGGIAWQRSCGGSGLDFGFAVTEMGDGSFSAFGRTSSDDGDVDEPNMLDDWWQARFGPTGALINVESYGGSNDDGGATLIGCPDGGVLLCGSSSSSDGDVAENNGGFDGWLVRADAQGIILWQLVMGGSLSDSFAQVRRLSDGGMVLVGASRSSNGDVPGNQGGIDVWVVKLGPDPVGLSEAPADQTIRLYPNPVAESVDLVAGDAWSGSMNWRIIDSTGRVAFSGACTENPCRIALEQLAPGEFTLAVNVGDRRLAKPFVKQ